MPFSASVALSAFSEEKAIDRPRLRVEALAQQGAQLVLGGDHRDLGAALFEGLHDGAACA